MSERQPISVQVPTVVEGILAFSTEPRTFDEVSKHINGEKPGGEEPLREEMWRLIRDGRLQWGGDGRLQTKSLIPTRDSSWGGEGSCRY